MGASNKTTNYDLPMFTGTDRPSWLGDFNNAMNLIDGAIKSNALDIATLNQRSDSIDAEIEVIKENVENNTTRIEANNANIATQGAAINSILSTIGTAFSTTSTYAVGEYCVYQNRLYRCITAVTTAGVFTPASWTLVNISDMIDPWEIIDWTPTIGATGSNLVQINSNTFAFRKGRFVHFTAWYEIDTDAYGAAQITLPINPIGNYITNALLTKTSDNTPHNVVAIIGTNGTLSIQNDANRASQRVQILVSGSYIV